jgi:hypothetical protein
MTNEELQALVEGLATATAKNTEAIAGQSEAIASLQVTAQIQLSAIENQRQSIGSNAQLMADSMEMASTALRMSAETTRNIDRLEQMMGILIRDNQSDRARITKLEE